MWNSFWQEIVLIRCPEAEWVLMFTDVSRNEGLRRRRRSDWAAVEGGVSEDVLLVRPHADAILLGAKFYS
jgi:hypothetical protein